MGREGYSHQDQRKNDKVKDTMLPSQLINKEQGWYYVDYVLYVSSSTHGPPKENWIYVTYSEPYRFLPSGMWSKGEPNQRPNPQDGEPGEVCILGKTGTTSGLADYPCSKPLNSIICEFPSEN